MNHKQMDNVAQGIQRTIDAVSNDAKTGGVIPKGDNSHQINPNGSNGDPRTPNLAPNGTRI